MSTRATLTCTLLALAVACTTVGDSDTPEPIDVDRPAADALPAGDLLWVRPNTCGDGSQMQLTTADGVGLALTSLKARAVVEGPLNFTELQLSFHNPAQRVIEGRFSIQLPPGAAISRFAMRIGDQWQEGEVVERQAARRAYEDFLHRRQDPALLENDGGNQFRARVFPIPAEADKHLIVSYSQAIADEGEPYRLPVCGLPKLGNLDVDVLIKRPDGDRRLRFADTDVTPSMDLEARTGKGGPEGLRRGDLVVARISPAFATTAEPIESLAIAFDTSASRALDFTGQVARLAKLVAALRVRFGDDLPLTVACFDQTTKVVFSGPAKDFGDEALKRIRARQALGASDLATALEVLARTSNLADRVIYVGDGVLTSGRTDPGAVAAVVRELAGAGVNRLDVIVDGGMQDQTLLNAITTAGLPSDGIVIDGRIDRESIVRRLGQATKSGLRVEVPGAQWVWPNTLDAVQAGDSRLVFAQLPEGKPLEVRLAGAQVSNSQPTLAPAEGPLLRREHAGARITSLKHRLGELPEGSDARRKQIVQRIVELSTTHRVLSDYTALLVLETEADYARFDIDRKSLVDIMTVGQAGIELAGRDTIVDPREVEVPRHPLRRRSKNKTDYKRARVHLRAEPAASEIRELDFEEGADGPTVPGGAAGGDVGEDLYVPPVATAPEGQAAPAPAAAAEAPRMRRRARSSRRSGGRARRVVVSNNTVPANEKPQDAKPHTGRFAKIVKSLEGRKGEAAVAEAAQWRAEAPGDVLALIALGQARATAGDSAGAARAYGSVIDLYPSRADMRRMAGEWLEDLAPAVGGGLVLDTYAKAAEQRPDHPSGHRLRAFALARAGRYQEAFDVLVGALERTYPQGRFRGVRTVLQADLGILAAAAIAKAPHRRKEITATVARLGATVATRRSLRFILYWETDANDVDLHVYDGKGKHAFYGRPSLPSGGKLIGDVTTGYGPECFEIEGKPKGFPYTLQAHYYSRGPMGYGMGKLQVVEHDGRGNIALREEPFVIMVDGGTVDLGRIGRSLKTAKK